MDAQQARALIGAILDALDAIESTDPRERANRINAARFTLAALGLALQPDAQPDR